jgi:hypothetical protein
VKLHDGELDIDEGLVRRLLRGQFPRWAGLPLSPVRSQGTDNVAFRRGWALAMGLGAWQYYPLTNPSFAELGHRTVNQVLTDASSST